MIGLGCGLIVFSIVFVPTFVLIAQSGKHTFNENLAVSAFCSGMIGGMVWLAITLLSMKDRIQFKIARMSVRKRLLSRQEQRVEELSFVEDEITIITCNALSEFFDLPPGAVKDDDTLESLSFDEFEPQIQLCAVLKVCESRQLKLPQSFWFQTTGLMTVADLSQKLKELITDLEDKAKESLPATR